MGTQNAGKGLELAGQRVGQRALQGRRLEEEIRERDWDWEKVGSRNVAERQGTGGWEVERLGKEREKDWTRS